MEKICYLFLLFIIYAFIGWVTEVINAFRIHKRFINRGFLIGPYCPIYGIGILLIRHILNDYVDRPLVLFVLAMFLCMLLEYLTSYIMEKLFNARWWDYSNQKFNINGRVCFETAIPFGLGGLFIMYLVDPLIIKFLNSLSSKLIIILGIILMIVFLTDLIISLVVILKIKTVDISKYKDDTEIINKRVKEYLMKHSILTRRLILSFPNAKIRLKNIGSKIVNKTIRRKNK